MHWPEAVSLGHVHLSDGRHLQISVSHIVVRGRRTWPASLCECAHFAKLSQAEPASGGTAQSAATEPADAAAIAAGVLAGVERTLKDNTAFGGASSEVYRWRQKTLKY